MSRYLKVTSRGTIMGAGRVMLKPGMRLSKQKCEEMCGGSKEVDRLVDQGYLVRLMEQTDPENPPLPPQVQLPPPHPAVVEKDEPGMETAEKGVATSNVKISGTPVVTDNGPWNLDPADLDGKDIHELNVMVAERGHGAVSAFETVKEATVWLSQDFEEASALVASSE